MRYRYLIICVFFMLCSGVSAENDENQALSDQIAQDDVRSTDEDSSSPNEPEDMTSNRPYLIRAIYDWLVDNELTPHILVDLSDGEVELPKSVMKDDRVILNISPTATYDLKLENELITFNARFDGTPTDVIVPVSHVLAVYAHENGQGMMFAE